MEKIALVSFFVLLGLFTSVYSQGCQAEQFYDLSLGVCRSCRVGCKACISREQCTTCKESYTLENGYCTYEVDTGGLETVFIIIIVISTVVPAIIAAIIIGICICVFCCAASQVNKNYQQSNQGGQHGIVPQNQFNATPMNANNWQGQPPYQPIQGGHMGNGQNNGI